METQLVIPQPPILPEERPVVLPPTDPSYFTLVVKRPERSTLMLPPLFVATYMNPVPRVVTLANTADGRYWVIVIQLDDDGVYFGRGWGVFRDAYGIGKKFILNFAHDNDTHFVLTAVNGDSLVSTTCPSPEVLKLASPGTVVASRSSVSIVDLTEDSSSESDEDESDTVSFVGFKLVTKCGRCGNVCRADAAKQMRNKRRRITAIGDFLAQKSLTYMAKKYLTFCPYWYTTLGPAAVSPPFNLELIDAFASKCLDQGQSARTLRVKGKGNYVVQVNRQGTQTVIFHGLSLFIVQCGLEVGDKMCIEESRREKHIWNVTIRKKPKSGEEPIFIA